MQPIASCKKSQAGLLFCQAGLLFCQAGLPFLPRVPGKVWNLLLEEMYRRRRGRGRGREIQWEKWEAPSELPFRLLHLPRVKRTPVWELHRNRIRNRKPSSGTAADALDFDWRRDERKI